MAIEGRYIAFLAYGYLTPAQAQDRSHGCERSVCVDVGGGRHQCVVRQENGASVVKLLVARHHCVVKQETGTSVCEAACVNGFRGC